jgi:hypothetical protein
MRTMSARVAILASLVIAWLSLASSAFAQDAAEIKKRGDDAMDGGRPADALVAYSEAYNLTKDPALLYNKGRALMALTDYPQALKELEAFDATAPQDLKQRVPGLSKMISDLRLRVTTVSIACDVSGARVRMRDRTIGTCPMPSTVTVNAGKSSFEVTAEGYLPWTKEIDLPPGGVAAFEVHLVSKQTTGVLVVRTSTAGARVSIDGKPLGNAPVEASLAAGTHDVALDREGYRPTKTTAVVTAGERREIELGLESEPGLLSRWWFWTGVGVVVAGGVAIAIAATTQKSPDKGTVAPGVVQGGLHGFRF